MDRKKKVLIVVGISLLLIVSLLAFFFFYSPKDGVDQEGGESFFFGAGENRDRNSLSFNIDEDRENEAGIFAPKARLRILHEEPVAGAITVETDGAAVRFIERKTAHIFNTDLNTLKKTKISNTTVPKIHEAIWFSQGKDVILRYLDDDNRTIKTLFSRLSDKKERGDGEPRFELTRSFLVDNIVEVVSSPNKDRIFWLTKDPNGIQGTLSNPDGSAPQMIFVSEFSEWLPQWYSENNIKMTTKASGLAEGHLYDLQISPRHFERTLGDVNGLTTLSNPDGSYVLYSKYENNKVSSFFFNNETRSSKPATVDILPEKCAWLNLTILYCGVPNQIPSGLYPDDWYQGKVSFSDSIFRIDASNNTSRKIYSPNEQSVGRIDIYKPFISESGKYLIFNNKSNMSLWSFTLEENF